MLDPSPLLQLYSCYSHVFMASDSLSFCIGHSGASTAYKIAHRAVPMFKLMTQEKVACNRSVKRSGGEQWEWQNSLFLSDCKHDPH
jgi:hypothetical protein